MIVKCFINPALIVSEANPPSAYGQTLTALSKMQLNDGYGVGIFTMKPPSRPVSLRLFVPLACLLVCIAMSLAYFFHASEPPSVLVLRQQFSRPLPIRDRLVEWIPGSSLWNWVQHLEDVLLGQRKPVKVYADIIAFPNSTDGAFPSSLALGSPSFSNTNGLQVWFLRGGELRSLRDSLKGTPGTDFLSHPRISTADGIEASMFVGQSSLLNGSNNQVGLKAGFFPRVRSHSTDLFAVISFSEPVTNQTGTPNGLGAEGFVSIQTNLDIAVRVQVPKGSGLLLLDGSSVGAVHRRFGVLIEPP